MIKVIAKRVVLPLMATVGTGVSTFSVGHYFTNWFIGFESSVNNVASSAWGGNPLQMMADNAGMKLVKHKITNKRELYDKIDAQAAVNGVRKCAARSLAQIESDNNKNRISEAGALGVLQVMPFNVKTAEERENLIDNDEFAIKRGLEIYKENLVTQKGNESQAALRYHCGSQCFGPNAKIGPRSREYVEKFNKAAASECKITEGK